MTVTECIAELIPWHELIKVYEQDVYFAPIYNTITLSEYADTEKIEKTKHYQLLDSWLCYKDDN